MDLNIFGDILVRLISVSRVLFKFLEFWEFLIGGRILRMLGIRLWYLVCVFLGVILKKVVKVFIVVRWIYKLIC